MNITLIAGARPNFMKIAPIVSAIQQKAKEGFNLSYTLVHTGQHYDDKMSDSFFRDLQIPLPEVNLGCGGGSQAEQTASIMIKFESFLLQHKADLVMVVGDVTSTMACAIVAQKLHIPVAHVEGGIRSGDWTMPEEINRLVTDSITNYFYTTTEMAGQNLKQQGVSDNKIIFVGNTMIDTLLTHTPRLRKPEIWDQYQLSSGNYIVLTIHRPSNVDHKEHLRHLMEVIIQHSRHTKLIFPVHPRTRKNLEQLSLPTDHLILTEPLGYLEFNYLVKHAMAVITDSGGVTEETTVMKVPCMTLRTTTERPETCIMGTNELLGINPEAIPPALDKLFAGQWKQGSIPDKWDGKAAERIVSHLLTLNLNR